MADDSLSQIYKHYDARISDKTVSDILHLSPLKDAVKSARICKNENKLSLGNNNATSVKKIFEDIEKGNLFCLIAPKNA